MVKHCEVANMNFQGITNTNQVVEEVQVTSRKLVRIDSKIPKAPVEEGRLFRNDGFDRFYSNIPYPPSLGSRVPDRSAFQRRRSKSFCGYSDSNTRAFDTQRSTLSEGAREEHNVGVELKKTECSIPSSGDNSKTQEETVGSRPPQESLQSKAEQTERPGIRSCEAKEDEIEHNGDRYKPAERSAALETDKCSFHWSQLGTISLQEDEEDDSSSTVVVCDHHDEMMTGGEVENDSFDGEVSLADSVLSLGSLKSFSEDENRTQSPTFKPLTPTFLRDCMKSMNGYEVGCRKQEHGIRETYHFCPKSFPLVAKEHTNLPVKNSVDISKKKRFFPDPRTSLMQHLTSDLDSISQPRRKKTHVQDSYDFLDTPMGLFEYADGDDHMFDEDLYSDKDSIFSEEGLETCLKETKNYIKGSNPSKMCYQDYDEKERAGWLDSALNVSLKVLAFVSGIAILVQNASKQPKIECPIDNSFLMFPKELLAGNLYPHEGTFPSSLLD